VSVAERSPGKAPRWKVGAAVPLGAVGSGAVEMGTKMVRGRRRCGLRARRKSVKFSMRRLFLVKAYLVMCQLLAVETALIHLVSMLSEHVLHVHLDVVDEFLVTGLQGGELLFGGTCLAVLIERLLERIDFPAKDRGFDVPGLSVLL
jgi:hypothetical protein